MGNVLIDLEAAKEYVQANYQGDPLLRHLYLTLLDALPKAEGGCKYVQCGECRFRTFSEGLLYCDHLRGLVGSMTPESYCCFGERENDE